MTRIVAVFPGRFQPFARHHFLAYEQVTRRFSPVYIGTVKNRDRERNPLSFEEKLALMSRYGIPRQRVFEARNPYRPRRFLRRFDRRTTAVVFAVGAKDADRMSRIGRKGKYYRPLPDGEPSLSPYRKLGYFIVVPHVACPVGDGESSGTAIRAFLGARERDVGEKRAFFERAFGWYDDEAFDLLVRRFEPASQ